MRIVAAVALFFSLALPSVAQQTASSSQLPAFVDPMDSLPPGFDPDSPPAPPLAYFDMYARKMTPPQCQVFRAKFPGIGAWAWYTTPCDSNPQTRGRDIHVVLVQNAAACSKLMAAHVEVSEIPACKPPPPPDPAAVYLLDTIKSATECRSEGGDLMACYIDAAPARCKQATIDFIGSRTDKTRTTWYMCVRSCASASVLSRVIGDCRR